MRRVVVRTGCRLDLAGGTLDVWPIGALHPGASTVNLAIDVAVEVEAELRSAGYEIQIGEQRLVRSDLEQLSEIAEIRLFTLLLSELKAPPLRLAARSQSPRGAGLGASSALSVATIAAVDHLFGRERTASRIVALARDAEARLMGLPTGCQDHYPPMLGGALRISHDLGGEAVQTLNVDLEALGRRLLVFFSGQSHISAETNWGVFRRRMEGDQETVERFQRIAEIAEEIVEPLETGDFATVGSLVGEEWEQRKTLAEGVTTPLLDQLIAKAGDLGAYGGKAGGAGGGGCVFFLAPEQRRSAIVEALVELGGQHLEAAPQEDGIEIVSE